MPEANIFQIENGHFALALVDTEAVGYLTTWQAPDGATAATAVLADYDASATSWSCQVTSGMLTASANNADVDVPATFCAPSRLIPNPGETSYTLDVEFLQDVHVSTGLSAFLFENDTLEAYFLLSLAAADPPRAIGRVRIQASAFGGVARETLTASVSLPLSRKPSIEFGDATTSVIIGAVAPDEDETPPPVAAKSKQTASASAKE